MYKGFWKTLPKPFFALAPMADVTDAAFRKIIAKYGKPDVMWTEFVSCDGLMSEGKKNLLIDLKYSEKERPIVAQIFGANPKHFYDTALLIKDLGFDGIDINMGCPDRAVVKQGAGTGLIKTPKLARDIIFETKRGAERGKKKIPVSVKTRIGFSKNELSSWLPYILECEPAAVTIHFRTKKEMSKAPARWNLALEAREIMEKYKSSALLIGNGDVESLEDAEEKAKKYGVDGVMIGRGIFGDPFCFNKEKSMEDLPLKKRLKIMLEHTKTFEKMYKEKKNFNIMKKHFKAYVSGFPDAKELRIKLMETKNAEEVENLLKKKGWI